MNGKYFKYAIGEIVLVVIGILIALSINNWNERGKQQEKTRAILSQVIDELLIDIEVLQNVNKGYLRKDSLINVYKRSDYNRPSPSNLDSSILVDLIRTYMPFEVHDRGFQLLMNHTDELNDEFAEDLERLIIIYQDAIPAIKYYMDGMFTILQEHKKYKYENYEWYAEGSLFQKRSDAEYEYYIHDPFYKNYMAVYREMYINIVVNARWFNDLSIKAIQRLEAKLDLESALNSFTLPVQKELIESMKGTYEFEEKSSDMILEVRNDQLFESTFEGDGFFGKAFDSQYITGELRYLGDSLFYHDVISNLRLNADGTITIEEVFGDDKMTSINKR